MKLKIAGTFIAYGPEVEPRVVLLAPHALAAFVDGLRVVDRYEAEAQRPYLYAQTFGPGITAALAVWDEAFTRQIGERYEGPHRARVRQLAAAIVLGISFEELDKRGGKDGGLPVAPKKRPIKPRPGGAAVAIPVAG